MIRPDRLHRDLETFARFGRTASGGVTRLALSPADREAREAFCDAARAAGLTVRVDAVGNLFARLEGQEPGPALWLGSHLDSVPEGGRFDGALGVLTALEVARALAGRPRRPARPLEVVVFTGEEGSRFPKGTLGSKACARVLSLAEARAMRDPAGVSVAEAMAACGYPADLPPPPDPATEAFAYLELHIEQGPHLERAGVPIGVVEAIAGLDQRTYRFRGDANHAGTTPMDSRRDALLGAAGLALAAEEIALSVGQRAVATCGRIEAFPGAFNIVPGEAAASFDLRAPRAGALDELVRRLDADAERLAAARGLRLAVEPRQRVEPGPLDAGLRTRIRSACERAGLGTLEMPSGAIHDALLVSRRIPAAMIFVPSRAGRSHCPEEHTAPEHIEAGLRALYAAALELLGE